VDKRTVQPVEKGVRAPPSVQYPKGSDPFFNGLLQDWAISALFIISPNSRQSTLMLKIN
jgi:hypothetical protein